MIKSFSKETVSANSCSAMEARDHLSNGVSPKDQMSRENNFNFSNMRKILTMLVVVIGVGVTANAQDIILKKDGSEIKAKVIEITEQSVKYKEYQYQSGATRNVLISDVFMITYENGTKEVFNKQSSTQTHTQTPTQTQQQQQQVINVNVSEQLKTPNRSAIGINLPQCGLIVYFHDTETEITWEQAQGRAPEGWRLPTLKELQCMCQHQERLLLDNKDEYWSSKQKGSKAYSVTLDDCEDELNRKSRTRAVRYVKDFYE